MNQQPLPGASSVLTMGIISIISTLICCGPFGAIFSIITLVKAKTATQLYNQNPDAYTDFSNVKTGKILAYIGLGFALIGLIFFIIYFSFIIAMIGAEEWGGGY